MAMDTRTVRLLLLLTTCAAVSALYFPQSDLSLRLPYLARGGGRLIANVSLFTVRALRNDSVEAKDLKYSVATPTDESVILDPFSGNLTLNGTSENEKVIIVLAKARNRADADLKIKVQPIPSDGKKNRLHYLRAGYVLLEHFKIQNL